MRDKLYNQFLLVGHIYDNLTPDNIKESSKSTHNSTFLAILSEWCIMRNRNFSLLGEKSTNLTLQVWIPGMKTEDYMYTQCAQHTGASQIYAHPIDVGDVVKQHKYDEHSPNLSFIKLKRRCIGIISARHYGTPLTPLYWREHINKCMF